MPMQAGPNSSAEQVLKVTPILLAALLLGMTSFAVIAAAMGPGTALPAATGGGAPAGPDVSVHLMAMGGLGAASAMVYAVFGQLARAQAKRAYESVGGDPERGRNAVAQVLMTTTIVRAGMCEGVGLLGAVIVLISGNMLGLAGVGYAAVMIGALLPVRSRFESMLRQASGAGFM